MKLVAYVGLTLSLALSAQAAPVDLSAPQNTLGAADMFGHLRILRELDNVDFGGGVELPLRVEFNSSEQTSSPYLGEGWSCPLVESNVFLRNKLLMQVTLLCGKIMYLERDKANIHIYHTPDMQWTGTLRGNTTIISRSDGWALTYWNGHILKMRTDTGRLFKWVTAGNIVTSIQEDGTQGPAPFQLATTAEGVPDGFYVNGKLYSFTLENKPRVAQDGAIRAVASLDPSLGSITWPDKSKETYVFALDTSTLTPNFEMTDRSGKQSSYTWDPATQNILSDGIWNYEVGPTQNDLDVPRITRRNAQGQDEFIAVDRNSGVTESKTIAGGHIIQEGFVSPGPLFGKTHKIEQVDDNGTANLVYQAGYDERGRLIRETDADGFTHAYTLDDAGKRIGQIQLLPTDPAKLKALLDNEKSMLKAIVNAKNSTQRDDVLQDLGFFYIHKLNVPDKALALLPQVTGRTVAFNIQMHAIDGSQTLTPAQKVAQLQNLLERYPERKRILSHLITANQLAITNANSS
jgi:YD repeat-containing protein